MLSEERLAEIRAMIDGCERWAPGFQRDAQAYRDLLAEHEYWAAEVERLCEDAAIGRAVRKIASGDSASAVEYRREMRRWVVRRGGGDMCNEEDIWGMGDTVEEALRAAGLMEEESDGQLPTE